MSSFSALKLIKISVVLALLLLAYPAFATHVGGPTELKLSDVESRLIAGINKYRAEHGKPALTVDPILMQVARERVPLLSFKHPHDTQSYGSEMAHASRYDHWRAIAGVWSAAYWSDGSLSSPESSVLSWRQSPGHAKCMLGLYNVNGRDVDEKFDCIGVARGGTSDFAIFGAREGTHGELSHSLDDRPGHPASLRHRAQ